MSPTRFVFQDLHGKRWRRIGWLSIVGVIAAFLIFVFFLRALLVLPRLRSPIDVHHEQHNLKAYQTNNEVVHLSPTPPAWLHRSEISKKPTPAIIKRSEEETEGPVVLGFYVSWDSASFESLSQNYTKLTHVAPEWFSMKSFDELLVETPDEKVLKLSESSGLKLVPMLSNLDHDIWQPELVETLARANPEMQNEFFSNLIEKLHEMSAEGILIDWEQVDPAYRDQMTSLLKNLAIALHDAELELWLCVPVGNDVKLFDLDALSEFVDRFVALLYDENGEKDTAGPVASQPWWTEWFDVLLEHGNPEQWVTGIGNFGYDWSQGKEAEQISFEDAMVRAKEIEDGSVRIEAPYYEPHFSYLQNDLPHTVWFLDSATFHNQYSYSLQKKVGGVALYRLGTEDKGLWKVVEDHELAPYRLERIPTSHTLANIGEGDFLTVSDQETNGERNITTDASGIWTAQYLTFPGYPTIYHRGYKSPNQVALTFDDGPNPRWTPRILDILKEEDLKATFFMVGKKVAEYQALVRRIVEEGHEIGNHSYSHPDLSESADQWTVFELNATQRLLEGITGVSTLLFRPPYHADTRPESYEELRPLLKAQELGYVIVNQSIDSEDWNDPTPEKIFKRVMDRRGEGNIILMHDGGGDRSATVEALPKIIEYLRLRDDEIVPLNVLLNVYKTTLMPPIPKDEPFEPRVVTQAGLELLKFIEEFAWAFMLGITILLLIRTVTVILLAARQKRNARLRLLDSDLSKSYEEEDVSILSQPISVLVAAYNEEKVIALTIQSVLNCRHKGEVEIVIVDDGSTDRTAEIIEGIACNDGRIRLSRQKNLGKARALQRALVESSHEIIVMLDADTQFETNTIEELLLELSEPNVGAVSGHVRVGNPHSWIARFQSLEYICGFNLDRRAYDLWNCITVVPGAVSAFRRTAIYAVGGIALNTLAEDTDLTLYLHRAHWIIRYASKAIARTEAPETVRSLARQRIRWAFGTLQCLWKHRDMLFNWEYRALGLFSLPSIWFCHVFLVALVPLVDGMLIISLISGTGTAIIEYALLFFFVEWLIAFAACVMEKEPLSTSLLIIPMRVIYRPILCYAVWTAILRALRGAWFGWSKLERRGSVGISTTIGNGLGSEKKTEA